VLLYESTISTSSSSSSGIVFPSSGIDSSLFFEEDTATPIIIPNTAKAMILLQ
jgi:hypothetical protein